MPSARINDQLAILKFTATFLVALDCRGTFRAREDGDLPQTQPLAHFLARFPDRALATDLFYLVEAVRIMVWLKHDFSGLLADFKELGVALLTQELPVAEVRNKGSLVLAVRAWLLRQVVGLPGLDGAPGLLPEAIAALLSEHCAPERQAGQSLTVTVLLYRFAETLAGPYLPGQPLPFMGKLTIAEAYEGIDRRQEERQEKLIEAIRRIMADQAKAPKKESEEGEAKPEAPGTGRQPLTDKQGAMLAVTPNPDLDAAALEQQLAQGVLRIGGMEFELTDELKELLREMVQEQGHISGQAIVSAAGRPGGGLQQGAKSADEADGGRAVGPLSYDEWDFRRAGFRKNWCQVQVKEITPVLGTFVANTLQKYRGLLLNLRRQFEMMSVHEVFLKRQRDGDEIDLDAVTEALSDAKAGLSPSERLYIRLQRNDRQIAALFLLDMSSSTEGWVSTALKESLILMCEALSALGDPYAIYGFSGMRRLRSEIFTVKEFDEPYDATIKGRIAAITPKEYTRMGPAIRHASGILANTEARIRLLITLSDGKPEDYDGYKSAYAIEDTRHALIEAKMADIHPFCITVDKEAHAYMAHMYGEVNYIFIDQVNKLPRRMPEIYRNLTS